MAGIGTAPAEGVPAAWNTYIAVDDIEATLSAADEAGAELLTGAIDASPWSVDFWVAGADGAAECAAALGGQVIAPPFDIPGFRSAVLADPAGAVFSVSELRM